MSADIHNHQRRLIAGVVVLAVLLILVIIAIFRSIPARGESSRLGHRSPAVSLNYCSPQDTRLCVVSFSQVIGGEMLVNFQVPYFLYPEFVLVINRYGVESTYECKKVKGVLTGVTCSGPPQVPGEVLQFKVFSKSHGNLLAGGKFAIIGLVLSTPVLTDTPTVTPTTTPATTTTPPGIPTFPITLTPSYPNPSYP